MVIMTYKVRFKKGGTKIVAQGIGVAEAKKRFSELLVRAAFAGERFLIERRGKPLAALVSLEDLRRLEAHEEGNHGDKEDGGEEELQGLLAAAGILADYEDFETVMQEVIRQRRRSPGRRVPL